MSRYHEVVTCTAKPSGHHSIYIRGRRLCFRVSGNLSFSLFIYFKCHLSAAAGRIVYYFAYSVYKNGLSNINF